jgi:osmoprotectant transport system permease protein
MDYLLNNPEVVAQRLVEHLALTLTALAIALGLALPLGLVLARLPRLRGPVLGALGVIYTIPSLSLFVLLIPLMGLGFWPAVTALVAYAQIVLVRNVLVGITSVEPAVVEAARGMGMSGWQLLAQVELPLALPLILAGTRIATLAIIGIGTIAAYINAGGLGRLLFEGVTTGNPQKIVAGALAVSLLAVAANLALWTLERRASV